MKSLIHSPFAAGARDGGHAKRSKAAGSSAKADSGESGGGARDTQLDMFHALGKLLYNKRLEPSDPKQMAPERAAHYASVEDQVRSDLRRPPQQAQPERVVEQYGVDWSQLCGQLHQNYLGFFTLSDQAAVAAEGLSDGALIGGWHEERSAREMSAELAASASVRALRWAENRTSLEICGPSASGRRRSRGSSPRTCWWGRGTRELSNFLRGIWLQR